MRITNQQLERAVTNIIPLAVPVVTQDILYCSDAGVLMTNGMATNGGTRFSAVVTDTGGFGAGIGHIFLMVLQSNLTWVTLAPDYGPVAAGGSVTIDVDISCNRVRLLACSGVLAAFTSVRVGATIKSV